MRTPTRQAGADSMKAGKPFKIQKFTNITILLHQVWAGYLEEGSIPTKIGSSRVGGRVGMVRPDLSQKLGRVGMAYPDLHHFRGKMGKVEDNPDSPRLLSLKLGRVGISQFPPILGSKVG